MTASNSVIDQAIEERLGQIRATANANKQEQKELEAMQGWQSLPDDLTDAQLGAAIVVLQSNPMFAMVMNQDVMRALGEKLNDIAAKDQARMNAIMQAADAFSKKPRIQPGMSLQVVVTKGPAPSTVVAFLTNVDENLDVSRVEKLDADLYLGMYVTPHQNRSLTGRFNMPVHYVMAGATVEPLVAEHYFAQGQNVIHVKGHMSRDGQMQAISMAVPFENNPAPAPKKDAGPAPTQG